MANAPSHPTSPPVNPPLKVDEVKKEDAAAAVNDAGVDPGLMSPPDLGQQRTVDKPIRDSGRWRCDVDHYWWTDQKVEAGQIVGDDTEFPLPEGFRPSNHMTEVDEDGVPVDERARKRTKTRHVGLPGQGGRR